MRILISIVCLLAAALTAGAQEFKEWVLYEMVTPVKSFTLDTQNDMVTQRSVSFDDSGKSVLSVVPFDAEGYPCSLESGLGDSGMTIKYDNARRLREYSVGPASQLPVSMLIKYEYEGDGVAPSSCRYEMNTGGMEVERVCRYSDYKFDSHGNWTSRQVSQTTDVAIGSDRAQETNTYTETRQIIY